MARNLNDIMNEIIAKLATNGIVVSNNMFSRRRITAFCYAYFSWFLETLFDTHTIEINNTIAAKNPSTKGNYKDLVLNFQYGFSLLPNGKFDNSNATAAQIEASKIVSYCAVNDNGDAVTIKVAKLVGSDLAPLDVQELAALQSYMQRVKDAGVFVSIVNDAADMLFVGATVSYYPMILNSVGVNILTGVNTVQLAIDNYLKSIEFDGEFSIQDLTDAVQKVNGVKYFTPFAVNAGAVGAGSYEHVGQSYRPASGYLKFYNTNDLYLDFQPYAN